MSLIIEIKTIPQEQHRYKTLGDYIGHEKLRFIQVSDMGNPQYEFLIALHELVEQALCIARGISEDAITQWDIHYLGDDPGGDPKAPYYREHVFSSMIEDLVGHEMGLDMEAYAKFLDVYCEERAL